MEILGATCGNSIRRRRKNRVHQVEFYLCQAKKRFQSTINLNIFSLQNERRRRIFLRFQSVTKGILPCKKSAAGENFAVSERY